MIEKIERRPAWQLDLVALLSGLIVPLAFAPFSLEPLILVAFAMLALTWLPATSGRAFWRGWLFGLGMFGLGVSWVYVSMNRFGGMSLPLAGFVTLGFVIFLAVFPALVGYLSKKMYAAYSRRYGIYLFVLIPVLWVMVEWIRSWIFTGFPWLTIGYSQIGMPIAGFAPVLGVLGVSYAAILTAMALLYGILGGKTAWHRAAPVIISVWVIGGLLKIVEWSEPVNKPIKVSLVQGNISQDLKWLDTKRLPTINLYAELSRKNWGSDLIIWPETAIPGFYHQFKPYIDQMAQEARMNSSELLVGVAVYDARKKAYYNAMTSLGNDEGFYEKKHLVPFGEYLPFKTALADMLDFFEIPMSDFSPGHEDKPLLNLVGQPVGISICYEDVFGNEVIDALPEATFLVNASNDAWFGDSVAPRQHTEIARMRALETGRYLLRATNTGETSVIDHKGRVQSTIPSFQVGVLTDTIQPMSGMSIYAVFGNIPVVVGLLLAMIISLETHRRYKKDKQSS